MSAQRQTLKVKLVTIRAVVVQVAQKSKHSPSELRQAIDSYPYGKSYRKIGM